MRTSATPHTSGPSIPMHDRPSAAPAGHQSGFNHAMDSAGQNHGAGSHHIPRKPVPTHPPAEGGHGPVVHNGGGSAAHPVGGTGGTKPPKSPSDKAKDFGDKFDKISKPLQVPLSMGSNIASIYNASKPPAAPPPAPPPAPAPAPGA